MIYGVIMAGGAGTRFWPLSRQAKPKQFLRIARKDTLLQATAGRILPVCGRENLLVVTCCDQARKVRRNLPGLPRPNVIVEPRSRNTAPAIGLAAVEVLTRDPEGVMVVLPSDHLVRPLGEFRRLIRAAAGLARRGSLVTLGVTPTRPETGYGYIHAGRPIAEARDRGACEVLRFVEKPDRMLAEEYLADGHYFWNSGMFIFRADVLLQAYAAHLPRLHRGLMEILAARRRNRPALITKLFSQIESVSIDYGVMEKASRLVMLPCGCQWNDVGSFASLHEVLPADPNGNIVDGDVLVLDSQGCVLRAESRLLACVGLKGLVVVETPDVVLVCPKEEAQRVGRLVEELRRRKRRDVL